jgi:phage baseplate assembly protein W
MAELPHFSYPFRFATEAGAIVAATTEQHSADEVADCMQRIVVTPAGTREELPEFGITEPNFQQAPVNAARLVTEVTRWEPRARLEGVATVDDLDELVSLVRLNEEVAV